MKQFKCFRTDSHALYITWLHVLLWAFKKICKLWQHLWLSLDVEWPFETFSRLPADIFGDERGTVLDIFSFKTCVDVNGDLSCITSSFTLNN